MAVLTDLPGMIEWTAAESVTVTERDDGGRPLRARWREHYGPLADEFVLEYRWHGDDGVSWRLLEGRILKKENGSYRLSATRDGTTIAYTLELGVRLWIPPCIRSRIESAVIDSTLVALARRLDS